MIYLHTVLLAAVCVPVRAAAGSPRAVFDLTHDITGERIRRERVRSRR